MSHRLTLPTPNERKVDTRRINECGRAVHPTCLLANISLSVTSRNGDACADFAVCVAAATLCMGTPDDMPFVTWVAVTVRVCNTHNDGNVAARARGGTMANGIPTRDDDNDVTRTNRRIIAFGISMQSIDILTRANHQPTTTNSVIRI